MKAIQLTEFGGPDKLVYTDLPDLVAPSDKGDQVLLKVSAAGINYADTHQTENSYLSPQKLPLIPGIEVVGTTPDGKRVLAPVGTGGYAQLALGHKDALIPIPDGVTDGEALAMMVQGSTAYHLLKTMGHVKQGETVVVHAAAGGVGVIAIQLAKMWGAKVIGVTSSQEKMVLATSLGADAVVDAKSSNLADAVIAANGGKQVDIVLEMIGGETFSEGMKVLAPFGRMITFGNASRSATREVSGGELMHGSKTVSGFWLSNCFGSKELLNDVILELFDLIASKKLKVIVGATYPLSEASRAHQELLARKTVGKLLLDPSC